MATLHRFRIYVNSTAQWYSVMNECRDWFGKNWKTQPKVRKKLETWRRHSGEPICVWFEVPDERWATWVSTKFALEVVSETRFKDR